MFDAEETALLRSLAVANGMFVRDFTERQKYIAYSLVDRGLASYDIALRISERGRDAAERLD